MKQLIDLRTCEAGDILISKHGLELLYDKQLPETAYYDHMIVYLDGSYGTRIDTGHTYKNEQKRLESDHDVIEIRYQNVLQLRDCDEHKKLIRQLLDHNDSVYAIISLGCFESDLADSLAEKSYLGRITGITDNRIDWTCNDHVMPDVSLPCVKIRTRLIETIRQ